MRLPVTKAGETVQFVCKGEGSSLAPDVQNVYRYADSQCSSEVLALDSLLPGATLKKTDVSGTFTLAVPALPENQLRFCYACKYKNPADSKTAAAWKPYTVVVTVAAREASPETGTSTQAPNTSAGAAAGVSAVGALVVALFSTTALK